ncbi:MAG: hypothetical protein KIT73_19265 [Burkholderiales bacterium]|nr:hypothetical protein [Burkholderiales bacterium]
MRTGVSDATDVVTVDSRLPEDVAEVRYIVDGSNGIVDGLGPERTLFRMHMPDRQEMDDRE